MFMLLFIHLLYLIWKKTLCLNCLRETLRLCDVGAKRTIGYDISCAHYKATFLLLYIN